MQWMVVALVVAAGPFAVGGKSGQTFTNDSLDNEGVLRELSHNLDAVRFIPRGRVYLNPERIIPSDRGMLLVKDDLTTILLPKVLSDQQGCYILGSTDYRLAGQLLEL
ncbi:MAG: hypothetical protein K940chlam2_01639 [Chlamydiae bacterium]|nr:hypothetical protein [Chlamydiota bacterium]